MTSLACAPSPSCAWPCPAPPPACVTCCVPPPVPATFQAALPSSLSLTATQDTQVVFSFPMTANPVAYTPFTGIFQAPTSGNYFFSATVSWSSVAANSPLQLSLAVSGQKAVTATALGQPTLQSATVSGILSLAAGQTVVVLANSAGAATIQGSLPNPAVSSWFSGSRA